MNVSASFINETNLLNHSNSNHLDRLILDLKTEMLRQGEKSYPDFSLITKSLDLCLEAAGNDPAPVRKAIDQFEAQQKEKRNYSSYCSLLYKAIKHEKELAIKLIRLKVAAINSKNGYEQETPLHLTLKFLNSMEILKELLANGADVDAVDGQGATALTICFAKVDDLSWGYYTKIVPLLLMHGADPKKGYYGQLPTFCHCILSRDLAWLNLIIDKVDVNCESRGLRIRPIHLAVSLGMTFLTQDLIERGGEINVLARLSHVDVLAVSPLHIAVQKGRDDIAEMLLNAGASPNLKSENPFYGKTVGQSLSGPEPMTPYQLAVDLYRTKIIPLMIKNNSNLDMTFPIEREEFPDTFQQIAQKGLHSTKLRLNTELAKGTCRVSGIKSQCRVYTSRPNNEELIRTAFNTAFQKGNFGAASFICEPILQCLEMMSQKNADLAICFVDHDESVACYNNDTGDELVLSNKLQTSEEIIPVLMHESAHKAAHYFYGSRFCAPTSKEFQEAWKKDLEHLEKTDYSECHPVIEVLWRQVKKYKQEQHPSEYFARLAHAAAIMAWQDPSMTQKDLEEIFAKSIPNIFTFFLKDFIPKCKAFV